MKLTRRQLLIALTGLGVVGATVTATAPMILSVRFSQADGMKVLNQMIGKGYRVRKVCGHSIFPIYSSAGVPTGDYEAHFIV